LDVEPPFALVSECRTRQGAQKAVAGVGGGTKPTRLIMSGWPDDPIFRKCLYFQSVTKPKFI